MSDVVITCLLNSHPDPQYAHHYPETGGRWPADVSKLTVLDSVRAAGLHAVVLHDCLDEPDDELTSFVRVPDTGISNAYFARWRVISEYLRSTDHEFVFCVDGGDVELLHDPFEEMWPEILYIGSEPSAGPNERHVGFWWMETYHPDSKDWISANADRDLLNPGLLGGEAAVVRRFARRVAAHWPSADGTDVGAANEVAYSPEFLGRCVTGGVVHTRYWHFETNGHSWFRHK